MKEWFLWWVSLNPVTVFFYVYGISIMFLLLKDKIYSELKKVKERENYEFGNDFMFGREYRLRNYKPQLEIDAEGYPLDKTVLQISPPPYETRRYGYQKFRQRGYYPDSKEIKND